MVLRCFYLRADYLALFVVEHGFAFMSAICGECCPFHVLHGRYVMEYVRKLEEKCTFGCFSLHNN